MQSVNFGSYRFRVTATTAVIALMLLDGDVRAQVTSDNTTNTTIQTSDDISTITGGIESGSNLFHSFEQFSLTTDTAASFDHAEEITNIFSRVTGGSVSEIDGLIQVLGDANLFLLNPAGVIFGANAQLDIGGSLVVSTGDRFIFEDGVFSAADPQNTPLLTVSSPVGLQYGGNPGDIEILPNMERVLDDSGLSIFPGNTLALLGGNVSIARNNLDTVGSNVEVGSVKSGVIALQPDDFGWQFDYGLAEDLGNIKLSDGALINSGGRVNFYGQTIDISGDSGIADFNNLNETKSVIRLEATESIDVNGGLIVTQVGQQRTSIDEAMPTASFAIADVGGDIIIQAPQVLLNNGAVVSAGTLSDGAGGSITIDASEQVILSAEPGNNPSIISTSTIGSGQGGQIAINTKNFLVENGSQIQALAGDGAGGTITINATEAVNISGTGILLTGDSEDNISETESKSGFFASSGVEDLPLQQQPQGKSGSLIINTPNLSIQNQAQISVSNYGLADAGDVKITTSNLNLNTLGEIVANTASGEGGSVDIAAEESIILDNGSSISTIAEQNGNGGNIAIATENLILRESNRISANASQGNGGNITVDTTGLFVDSTSSITASSEVEQKNGSVEIFTLDLNSRLATDRVQKSSLIVENKVSRRCGAGANVARNQLRDVGRGGIPSNLLGEAVRWETIGDLGKGDRKISNSNISQAKIFQAKSESLAQKNMINHSLIEANRLIVNSQGVLELVSAQQLTASLQPSCIAQ